ncbi:MAG: 3-oxoacyl-ACP reductase FabG [Thermosynechococcus sp.]|uniref:3-oxoacyl-ACP reductase FabG n=1 Tax=Thermosynechococcus sp. TaxID=2814275 RepID=UPI00391CED76
MRGFAHRAVLVTGGTGGLGQGVVPVLLSQGYTLTIPYIDAAAREALEKQLAAAELANVRFVAADLNNESEVAALVERMPQLDAVVHLVGGFSMGTTAQFALSDWQQSFRLNVETTFLVCKHALKRMQSQQYGRIVTIGSRGAVEPAAELAAYCAAKAAVVAFTRAIAAETKGKNITANVILPSIIDTPANRAAMGEAQAVNWVSPVAIGELIAYLISEGAAAISGAVIPIYGNA